MLQEIRELLFWTLSAWWWNEIKHGEFHFLQINHGGIQRQKWSVNDLEDALSYVCVWHGYWDSCALLLCSCYGGGVYGEKIYLMVLMFENCWRQEARVALMNFGGLCGWWAPASLSLLSVLFLFYFLLQKPLSFSHHQFAEEHTHLSKAAPNHPSTSAGKRKSNIQIAKRGLKMSQESGM